MDNRSTVPAAWASWTNAILGVWLIIAPFILGYQTAAAFWNDIILGIVVLVLAYSATQTMSPNPSWWIVALGVWLIIAPFVLGYIGGAAYANDIIVGAVVILMGFVAAASKLRVPGAPIANRPGS